jgi:phage baseplate assembly protein W
MSNETNFLGRGWAFPPVFYKESKTVGMEEGVSDINSSLFILLNTVTGERVMEVKYGCDMKEFVFEPLTTTLKTYMTDKIKTAIAFYEPRIEVENVELTDDEELEGKVIIDILYKVRSTNSRYNFVFPFYKQEGTELQK